MTADHSIVALFMQAGLVVKTVMLMLLVASVISWTVIFQRASFLKKARRDLDKFEDRFWSGSELSELYAEINQDPESVEGLDSIFLAGFTEFARLQKQGVRPVAVMEGAQRAMRVANSREMDKLDQNLPFLATVGSISPYVGLFGTVWGIMTSFQALGTVTQATIAMVAPGISEALIATAMGLFAAIPAVIAYNRFASNVERLLNHYDSFQEEFASILYRQANVAIPPSAGEQPDLELADAPV